MSSIDMLNNEQRILKANLKPPEVNVVNRSTIANNPLKVLINLLILSSLKISFLDRELSASISV